MLLLGLCMLISEQLTAQKSTGRYRALAKTWNKLGLADQYHVGLSMYDLEAGKSVFNYRGDNFFIPGSNIKILTMYAAMLLLDDQLDAAWYKEIGDSIFIWGGGDPGTFYPNIDTPALLPDFIRGSTVPVVFADPQFRTSRYGKGWAWDDFPYTFQCERNAFPIYGNRLWIERHGAQVTITPSCFYPLVNITTGDHPGAGKSEWGEGYFYIYDPDQLSDKRQIPITYFKNDIQFSWSAATGKEITFTRRPLPVDAIPIKGSWRDTLISQMMIESDNFIAEQLLLACSMKGLNYMKEGDIIDTLLHGPLRDLPAGIKWVDGSGLSRYNLLTPQAVINVLLKLIEVRDIDFISGVFPAGGQSGTLKDNFIGKGGQPYIWAKSGSMRNTYSLSGMLRSKSGRVFLFSWMNNQFVGDSAELKASMEKLFSFLYDHY